MKFCKDCKHVAMAASPEFIRCGAPQSFTTGHDLVTGELRTTQKIKYAVSQRMPGVDGCGPDANWFEPREPEKVAA